MKTKLHNLFLMFLVFNLAFLQPCRAGVSDSSGGMYTTGILAVAGVGVVGGVITALLTSNDDEDKKEESSTTIDAAIPQSEITADAVVFTEPGIKTLTLKNVTREDIVIDNIQMGTDINNVRMDASGCTSTSIAANGTCDITLTAAQDAYGSGKITIPYNDKVATVDLTVAGTTLNFSYPTQSDVVDEITMNTGNIYTVTVINKGKFTWQNPNVAWEEDTALAGVSLTNSCISNVAPNGTCTFVLNNQSQIQDSKNLVVSGLNLDENNIGFNVATLGANAATNPADGVSIELSNNRADESLGYRAIVVHNNSGSTVTISDISRTITKGSSANSDGTISYCGVSDTTNCDSNHRTGPTCENGGNLLASAECKMWFKANSVDKFGLGKDDGRITVSLAVANASKREAPITRTKTFKTAYTQYLYAGGLDKGNDPGYVFRWDGSTWTKIGTAATSTNNGPRGVMSFALKGGDLYAGGDFSAMGGISAVSLAKWNGKRWSALKQTGTSTGTPEISGYVSALTTGLGDNLYSSVIGYAPSSVGLFNPSASYIAQWVGSLWRALGNSPGVNGNIRALASLGDYVYAGGSFSKVNGNANIAENIARWNGAKWYSVASAAGFGAEDAANWLKGIGFGTNDSVFAITTCSTCNSGYGAVYVGGAFTEVAGRINALRVAKWEIGRIDSTSNWVEMSSYGVNDDVYALTILDGKLYVGGRFNKVIDSEGGSYYDVKGKDYIANRIIYRDEIESKWEILANKGTGANGLGNKDVIRDKDGKMLSNPYDAVYALAGINGKLYAGGEFEVPTKRIAVWDTKNSSWSALDKGLTGTVRALIVAPSIEISN